MDPTLAKALKEKERLQRRIKKIDEFIELYELLFKDGVPDLFPDIPAVEPVARRRNKMKPAEIADAVENILLGTGRPMSRGELVDYLESTGVDIESEDKARYIGTILWRHSKRFENIEGKGYWLKGVPMPVQGKKAEPDTSEKKDSGSNLF